MKLRSELEEREGMIYEAERLVDSRQMDINKREKISDGRERGLGERERRIISKENALDHLAEKIHSSKSSGSDVNNSTRSRDSNSTSHYSNSADKTDSGSSRVNQKIISTEEIYSSSPIPFKNGHRSKSVRSQDSSTSDQPQENHSSDSNSKPRHYSKPYFRKYQTVSDINLESDNQGHTQRRHNQPHNQNRSHHNQSQSFNNGYHNQSYTSKRNRHGGGQQSRNIPHIEYEKLNPDELAPSSEAIYEIVEDTSSLSSKKSSKSPIAQLCRDTSVHSNTSRSTGTIVAENDSKEDNGNEKDKEHIETENDNDNGNDNQNYGPFNSREEGSEKYYSCSSSKLRNVSSPEEVEKSSPTGSSEEVSSPEDPHHSPFFLSHPSFREEVKQILLDVSGDLTLKEENEGLMVLQLLLKRMEALELEAAGLRKSLAEYDEKLNHQVSNLKENHAQLKDEFNAIEGQHANMMDQLAVISKRMKINPSLKNNNTTTTTTTSIPLTNNPLESESN